MLVTKKEFFALVFKLLIAVASCEIKFTYVEYTVTNQEKHFHLLWLIPDAIGNDELEAGSYAKYIYRLVQ